MPPKFLLPAWTRKIRVWVDACNKLHKNHCVRAGNQRNRSRAHPKWLIDVRKNCLSDGNTSSRYLALSYVWESASTERASLQTNTTNLDYLKTPGSLRSMQAHIPPSVQNAMRLVAELGERYLWVDRFCIVQDDPDSMYDQIKAMPHIYANAYLTIVAAYSDGNEQMKSANSKAAVRHRKINHDRLLRGSKWSTRAWTLQELLFSKRVVFLFDTEITWECHCARWNWNSYNLLALALETPVKCHNRLSTFETGLQHCPWPDMEELSLIVKDYSARRMTYVEDTLAAFIGITEVLSKSFPGGFFYGLPVAFFDVSLLWRPDARATRKIVPGKRGVSNSLPSWSWLGWDFGGKPVEVAIWQAASNYVLRSNNRKNGKESERIQSAVSTKVFPTVKKYIGRDNLEIRNDGLEHRFCSSDRCECSLSGWKKGLTSFRHESDPLTEFRYPVPIVDQTSLFKTVNLEICGPFLRFQTTSALFKVQYYCVKTPGSPEEEDIAIANICDESGNWAGHFRAHNMWLGLSGANWSGMEEALEFIAISEGSDQNGSYVFNRDFFDDFMDENGLVNYVNVLWIEKVKGIAYRKGLGHILKSAWVAQAKNAGTIILG